MSALPCSSSLPWLRKGSRPFGLSTSVAAVWWAPSFVLAHTICRPSRAKRPSASATSSGSPWNGAVCSMINVFMCKRPRLELIRSRGPLDGGSQQQATLVRRKVGARVAGATIVPHHLIALAPDMGIDEFRLFTMIEEKVQERVTFLFGHALNFYRHQPVHIYRLAAGLVVGANDGMRGLARRVHALLVSPNDRIIDVVVHRATALNLRFHLLVQRVVGGGATGE